jgi:hypothetical protein
MKKEKEKTFQSVPVIYDLDGEMITRLNNILEVYHTKEGLENMDIYDLFSSLMLAGAKWDIMQKLNFLEYSAGIIDKTSFDIKNDLLKRQMQEAKPPKKKKQKAEELE